METIPVVKVLVVTEDWLGVVHGGFLQWKDQKFWDENNPIEVENSREFHIGEFLSVLMQTKWVGFNVEITRAHRSMIDSNGTPVTDKLELQSIQDGRGADVVNFRFNLPFTVNGQQRTLDDYDVALMFGMNKQNPDKNHFLDETQAIFRFMERGGGFFATGDHENVGASLCGLIPRVRSMRRWWYDENPAVHPQAPPSGGRDNLSNAYRHDTTQPRRDGKMFFENQSDDIPQPIEPLRFSTGKIFSSSTSISRSWLPHPLLCSPLGLVAVLPDHMHEGTCEVPQNLYDTFQLGDEVVREYPDYVSTTSSLGPLSPVVVARAHIGSQVTPEIDSAFHMGDQTPAAPMTFGVIGAWDGHLVSKGRVVVDSTFHHFVNINLTGDRYLENNNLEDQDKQKLHGFYIHPPLPLPPYPCADYLKIQWYYRNIVYWLIPASRRSKIWWGVLKRIAQRPRFLEGLASVQTRTLHLVSLDQILNFGQLADEYLRSVRGACAVKEVIIDTSQYPRIPPEEWRMVVERINIWKPNSQTEPLIGREQLEVIERLGLGAAMLAFGIARDEVTSRDQQHLAEYASRAFPKALAHASSTLSVEMEQTIKSSQLLLKSLTGVSRL